MNSPVNNSVNSGDNVNNKLTRRFGLLIVAVVILATGCGTAGVSDKTGSTVKVLRIAAVGVLNDNGQSVAPEVFFHELERVSGGRMKATLQTHFEDGSPTAESDLIKAIGAGKYDGGWPATRSFASAGIHGLEPLEAPMTLTSYDAQRTVVAGPVGASLLKLLDPTPVLGLGLAVGPLRRPWDTDKALRQPRDWRGTTFRVTNSPVQMATVKALGGAPVNASYNFPDLVETGKLHGAETDIAQYTTNDYGLLLPKVARNVVLWPRMLVLSISRTTYDHLDKQQQHWVRQAARAAIQATIDYPYDETTPARTLCDLGVRFIDASPAQLAALKQAVASVIDHLAADPVTAATMQQLQAIAATHPAPDVPDVPPSCRQP
jgi:TRAP-type C4-dicarboxylate transport system substrate-binding protein